MSDDRPSLIPNSTPLERALEQVLAARLTRYEAAADKLATLWNPASCPAQYLPWLAFELAVPYWRADWSEQQKRSIIAAAPAINSRRGHVDAIHRGLAAIGLKMEITLWHRQQPEGQPGTFSAILWVNQNPPASQAIQNDAMAMVQSTKRQSQHAHYKIGAAVGSTLHLAAAAASTRFLSARGRTPQGLPAHLGQAVAADAARLCTARATAPFGLRLGTAAAAGAAAVHLIETRMTVQ